MATSFYRYGDELRPVTTKPITLSYRTADGEQAQRTFTTQHGPVVRQTGGRWVAFGLLNKPIEALQQSFLRTKARDYGDYIKVANLKANSPSTGAIRRPTGKGCTASRPSRTLALREGGNSGDPASPHFFDQAERFASGDLGPVYFEPEDLKGHIERTYKQGK